MATRKKTVVQIIYDNAGDINQFQILANVDLVDGSESATKSEVLGEAYADLSAAGKLKLDELDALADAWLATNHPIS